MHRKRPEIFRFPVISGAGGVTRTPDLLITNQLLYRLSYTSTFLTACTFYHMSPWMSTKKFDDYYLFSCMKKCRISAQVVDFFRFLSVVQNLHCYTPPEKHALFQAFPPAEKIKVLTFSWQCVYITFCRLPVCCELSTFSTDFSTPDFLFYFKCLLRFCTNKETVETDFVDFAKSDFVTITQISRSRERFEKKLDRQNAGFVPLVMIQSRPLSANDT